MDQKSVDALQKEIETGFEVLNPSRSVFELGVALDELNYGWLLADTAFAIIVLLMVGFLLERLSRWRNSAPEGNGKSVTNDVAS